MRLGWFKKTPAASSADGRCSFCGRPKSVLGVCRRYCRFQLTSCALIVPLMLPSCNDGDTNSNSGD